MVKKIWWVGSDDCRADQKVELGPLGQFENLDGFTTIQSPQWYLYFWRQRLPRSPKAMIQLGMLIRIAVRSRIIVSNKETLLVAPSARSFEGSSD